MSWWEYDGTTSDQSMITLWVPPYVWVPPYEVEIEPTKVKGVELTFKVTFETESVKKLLKQIEKLITHVKVLEEDLYNLLDFVENNLVVRREGNEQ